MSKSKAPISRIKGTLRHVAPPVWSRIEVPGDTEFGKLHSVVQAAVGWTDAHRYGFRARHDNCGVPNPNFPDDIRKERNVRLDQITAEGDTGIYDYDFGDGSRNTLKTEKILPADPAAHYPRCTAGSCVCLTRGLRQAARP